MGIIPVFTLNIDLKNARTVVKTTPVKILICIMLEDRRSVIAVKNRIFFEFADLHSAI